MCKNGIADKRSPTAQLWPGAVHWPDFKNPATLEWWLKQIQGINDTLPVDGIWLDMNEVCRCGQLCPCSIAALSLFNRDRKGDFLTR